MFNIIFRRSNTFLKHGISNRLVKRFFLSNSYACSEAWDNRLKLPVLQKIDVEDLYYQLDRNFSIGAKVSVLDIDLFANGISADSHLEILEDILFKLRLNPECGALLDSTNHAVVRWYWALKQKPNLLNLLSERLTYGVFLDYYLSNLLMDTYLKENDVVAATKIAVLQMLQEECKHPITTPLALHACYKYLNSSEIWPPPPPEEEVDEDELIKVRVVYLRNPYFDDHFDIVVPNHLVGKTMVLFGKELDGPIGVSSQMIGYSLYEKHNENIDLLENILNKKISVYKEALAKAKEYTQKKPKQVESAESTEDAESKESEEIVNVKGKVVKLIEEIEKLNIAKDSSLETETAELVKKAVKEHEDVEIKNQIELYKKWEEDRERLINFEISEQKKMAAKLEIDKLKEELKKEEEKIFFFDKEEEIEVIGEQLEEEKKNLVVHSGKERLKEHKIHTVTYIPPDVKKKA